jgi:hypothetical protein
MRMPMEGFQQYPNLSSLRLVKLEGLGKDQGVRIGASGPSNLAIESIKMPPLLPSFDQQTKRFELGHLGFQILRRRASKCPHCCHPSINRPRGSVAHMSALYEANMDNRISARSQK